MTDDDLDRFLADLDAARRAGLVRWRNGRVQVHRSLDPELSARIDANAELVAVLLTPLDDPVSAILALFPGAVIEEAPRGGEDYWANLRPVERPLLPDGSPHAARCDRCRRPAGTRDEPLFGADRLVCRICWEDEQPC